MSTPTTPTKPSTVTRKIHFAVKGNRKRFRRGNAPESTLPQGRTPRVAKLMALRDPLRPAPAGRRGDRPVRARPPRPRHAATHDANHEPAASRSGHPGGGPPPTTCGGWERSGHRTRAAAVYAANGVGAATQGLEDAEAQSVARQPSSKLSGRRRKMPASLHEVDPPVMFAICSASVPSFGRAAVSCL